MEDTYWYNMYQKWNTNFKRVMIYLPLFSGTCKKRLTNVIECQFLTEKSNPTNDQNRYLKCNYNDSQ